MPEGLYVTIKPNVYIELGQIRARILKELQIKQTES